MLSKERILELYLNNAEWGPGIYGASEAAHYHFKKPLHETNSEEKIKLVTLLASPLKYTPETIQQNPVLYARYKAIARYAQSLQKSKPSFRSELRELP